MLDLGSLESVGTMELQTQSAAGVSTVKFSGKRTISWRQRNLADRPTGSRREPAPLLAFFCASSN